MRSKDIAKLAGVSRSTVSRVINNYPNVPEETRKKVEKVIEECGYIPNNSARNLVGKSNKIIGVFVIDFSSSGERYTIHSSPFFSEFIAYAIDKAQTLGYNMLITVINKESKLKEMEVLFRNKTISGAICMGDQMNKAEIEKLTEKGYKITLINQETEVANKNMILINTANVKGAYVAAQELIENGHKMIGHITGDDKKLSVRERLEGFQKKLKEENLKIYSEYISNGKLHREKGGYEAMKKILKTSGKNLPTAIFAANDLMAIGAIRAIKESGLSVPNDISIIGFDNIEMSKYSDPALSTIDYGVEDVANVAVSKLVDLIEIGEIDDYIVYLSKVELKKRESIKNIT